MKRNQLDTVLSWQSITAPLTLVDETSLQATVGDTCANLRCLGVAFGTTNASSIDNLNVIRTWPGRDGEWKVPSRIAYAHENIKYGLKDKNAWGYDVDPIMISCSWTKLLLDMDTVQSAHDDPNLQFAVDQGMLRTPEDYTAQQVCSDYLKEIHKYVMARLIKQYSKQVLDSTPIDCWLTVPAVWSDHAQSSTMAAAQAAGFGCGLKNTINIISEPEAGAIAALEKFMHEGSLNRLRVCIPWPMLDVWLNG
jgi:molecular chaperone DnaK (HSP70)